MSLEMWMICGLGLVVTLALVFWVLKSKRVKTPANAISQATSAETTPVAPVSSSTPPSQPKTMDEALAPTRSIFFGRIKSLFSGDLGESHREELEEILYTSDLGPKTVQRLMDIIDDRVGNFREENLNEIRGALRSEMLSILEATEQSPLFGPTAATGGVGNGNGKDNGAAAAGGAGTGLTVGDTGAGGNAGRLKVWMVVGVNGAGKTTTIGKLAHRLATNGEKVLIAAGDTFRAAAGEQLKVWSERAKVEIFYPDGVTSPSAVAFDACKRAQADGCSALIIDTAGRLHTQKPLMEELKKMRRVVEKAIPGAPHEVLLVLDANAGQNALIQAREFHDALQVSGVVLTKMDGSAKGGVAIGVANELGIPIKLIGIGEAIEDLRAFSPKEFVEAII